MFFLLRVAFWLGLVLVLLPTDKTPESDKLPQVGAAEAVSAATMAVSDLTQFCARQPQACAIGGQAATVIGHRAQSGAKKVYEFIREQKDSKSDEAKPGETKTGDAKPHDAKPGDVKHSDRKNAHKNAHKNADETGSIGGQADAPERAPADTLTPQDVGADWRGTMSDDQIIIEQNG
jgi:hypothetical protein